MEGIARTLMVYKGTIPYPNYNVVVPAEPITMTVHPEVPSRLLQHPSTTNNWLLAGCRSLRSALTWYAQSSAA